MQHALLPLYSPLETTPHKAGVIRDGLLAAAITLVAVSTERRGAAAFDGAEHLHLGPGQGLPIALYEPPAGPADDVRHLPGWPLHP